MKREFNTLALAGAGSGDHPPDTGCRQAQASSLLRSQEEYFNTRHSAEQTAKATLVTVPAPGPSAAPAQGAAEERGYLQWVPSRTFKRFPAMSSSSSLNTLQICSLQALNWSRFLSLPAGDEPASILLKKETSFQEFTKKTQKKPQLNPPQKNPKINHQTPARTQTFSVFPTSPWTGATPALLLWLLGREKSLLLCKARTCHLPQRVHRARPHAPRHLDSGLLSLDVCARS